MFKIYNLTNKIKKNQLVATIGYFDGLHLGHMTLIKKCLEIAKKDCVSSAVITFFPSPSSVLSNNGENRILTTIDDKQKKLKKLGVDFLIVIDFKLELGELNYLKFQQEILDKLNITTLICGDDFRYGKGKEGTAQTLKLSYNTISSPLLQLHNRKIASSWIVEVLNEGNIYLANKLLGYNYIVKGQVIGGNKLGRTIGFPTANIENKLNYYLPKDGVYIVKSVVKEKLHYGIANIGTHPTINELSESLLEVHLLNHFNEDIYDEIVEVEFITRIREQMKFLSLDALVEQLNKDKKYAVEYIKKHMDE